MDLLLKRAELCDDKAMQSVALFNMGKMLYYQGNKDKGYEFMEQAVAMMEKTDYPYKYDNLRYNYNTLLIFQESDRRSEEALKTLAALERIVTEETGSEIPMEGLSGKEKRRCTPITLWFFSGWGGRKRLTAITGYFCQ